MLQRIEVLEARLVVVMNKLSEALERHRRILRGSLRETAGTEEEPNL